MQKEKKLEEVKDEIVKLLYDKERNNASKNLAYEFKEKFNSKFDSNKIKNNYFNEKTTDWITLDNRLGKK